MRNPEDAFRHVMTVECIGFKRGTGGMGYLRKMLDVALLTEIWKLRTDSQEKVAPAHMERAREAILLIAFSGTIIRAIDA